MRGGLVTRCIPQLLQPAPRWCCLHGGPEPLKCCQHCGAACHLNVPRCVGMMRFGLVGPVPAPAQLHWHRPGAEPHWAAGSSLGRGGKGGPSLWIWVFPPPCLLCYQQPGGHQPFWGRMREISGFAGILCPPAATVNVRFSLPRAEATHVPSCSLLSPNPSW